MMLAHYPRQIDGLGQRIVVNMQACIVWTLMNEQAMPFLHGNHLRARGVFLGGRRAAQDGVPVQGRSHLDSDCGRHDVGNSTKALIEWMGRRVRLRLDAHQGLGFVGTRQSS